MLLFFYIHVIKLLNKYILYIFVSIKFGLSLKLHIRCYFGLNYNIKLTLQMRKPFFVAYVYNINIGN